MKKTKLLTPILSLGIVSTTLAPLAGCSCNVTSPVTLDKTLTDKGYSVKSYKLEYLKDSFIELNTPKDKDIEDVEVKVGDLTITKGEHLRVDGKTIWIEGNYMVANTVTINSVTLVKKVTGLSVDCTHEWVRRQTMKSSDLVVKLTYDDESLSDALAWKTGYTISKNDVVISDFDTTGYTFTNEDAIAGSVTFKLTYVTDPTFTYSLMVNVAAGEITQDDFIDAYTLFYANYLESARDYSQMSFDAGGKFKGKDTTAATIYYSGNNEAVATFDCTKPELCAVGGALVANIKTHLGEFDDENYTKVFTVGTDSISYTIALKSDSTKYETVTYNSTTYMTKLVNTFDDLTTHEYSGTNLVNNVYFWSEGHFNGIHWETAIKAIDKFEAVTPHTQEDTIALCDALDPGVTHEFKDTAKTTLETYLVGKKGSMRINNLHHAVVCIGAMHDVDENGKTVALTFQLDNLISGAGDKGNEVMACRWHPASSLPTSGNWNYINDSQLRGNLNDNAIWYGVYWDDEGIPHPTNDPLEENRGCLPMMQDATTGSPIVANAIKTTKHVVATTTNGWDDATAISQSEYTDKLFALNYYSVSASDRAQDRCAEIAADNPVYKYYDAPTEAEEQARRIRKDMSGRAWRYWISSPNTVYGWTAWNVYSGGSLLSDMIWMGYYGLAPAFCI